MNEGIKVLETTVQFLIVCKSRQLTHTCKKIIIIEALTSKQVKVPNEKVYN